jgi:arylsulfatase A-like enzyme
MLESRTTTESARPRRKRGLADGQPRYLVAQPGRAETAATVLWLGIWWALVAALAETLAVGIEILCFGYSYLGSLQMHRYVLWAIGVSDLLIMGAGVLLLALLGWLFPGRRTVLIGFWLQAAGGAMAFLFVYRSLASLSATMLALGFASGLVRAVRPDGPRYRRIVAWTYPMLAFLPVALATGAAWHDHWRERSQLSALPPPLPGRPNVLLIVLDTVRADALSCYGYARPTTPNLDRLAARGLRFSQARSPATWTLPAHGSLFTGRWPHELSAGMTRPLDDAYPTLAESMMRHGYETAGFVANAYFCNTWQGVARGFIHYADTPLDLQTVVRSSAIGRKLLKGLGLGSRDFERSQAVFGRKSASTINREFLRWLDQREAARPFFVFLNYFDVHDPYLFEWEPDRPFGLRPTGPDERRLLRDWHLIAQRQVTPRQIQLARDCYDDCLAALDRELGRLLDALEQRGLGASTWIVITSDHGEQFGEHDLFEHGNSLHTQVTRVPLLIIPPVGSEAGPPRVIASPVSLCDVPATVLDVIGAGGEDPFPGGSLRQLWQESSNHEPVRPLSPAVSEMVDRDDQAPSNWVPGGSVTADGLTFIRTSEAGEALYDPLADPDETRDLATRPEYADRLARLRAMVDTIVPRTGQTSTPGRPGHAEED